jgi:hypothetical protein
MGLVRWCLRSSDAAGHRREERSADDRRRVLVAYGPFWSLLITLDILVIWAVAAHGGAMRDPV